MAYYKGKDGSNHFISFGNCNIDGSYRITQTGDGVVIQKRESGEWVTKATCDDDGWGGGGSGMSSYLVPVWAEENAALGTSNTYEWAFGNGANTPADGGLTVYVPTGEQCHVVAMSLRVGGGTATVEIVHNGTPKGEACQVVLSSGQSATDEMDTPLELSNNDYINFRTSTSSGTSGPCVVTAWLKYEEA